MKKLLAVYNTTGIGGNDGGRASHYLDAIRSLIFQDIVDNWGGDYQIAISSCCNTDGVQNAFIKAFGDNISYNFVEEALPLSITFNDTVHKVIKEKGPFESYLYIDSGIDFWDPSTRFDAIGKLYDLFISDNHAILAAFPSNDDGSSWWKIQYVPGIDHEFLLGSCTNMHCQLFSEKWRSVYGRILPDIFASNCMESVFSVMARAINQKYKITQKVHVKHLHSLDGASMAARTPNDDYYPMSNTFKTPGMFFRTKKTADEIYKKGWKIGFGIEAYQEWWRPRPDCYGPDGYAIHSELKDFCAKELYLSNKEFDYSKIKARFIPSVR